MLDKEIEIKAKSYWTFDSLRGIETKIYHRNQVNFLERLFWSRCCNKPMIKVMVGVIDSDKLKNCDCSNCRQKLMTWHTTWVCSDEHCHKVEIPSVSTGGGM